MVIALIIIIIFLIIAFTSITICLVRKKRKALLDSAKYKAESIELKRNKNKADQDREKAINQYKIVKAELDKMHETEELEKQREKLLAEIAVYKTKLADVIEEIGFIQYHERIKENESIDVLKKQRNEIIEEISSLRKERDEIIKEIEELSSNVEEEAIARIEIARRKLEEENDPPEVLSKISKAWADYQGMIWDMSIYNLIRKPRPISYETANDLKKRLSKYKAEIFDKYKETQYKYEYLLSLFPELQEYIDGEAVRERTEEVTEEYEDRRVGYLTKEEWESLTDTQKSQLALDRYNEQRKRTKEQVGRDYEEYVAYLFRKKLKGCDVVMFGEQKGLNDLGRDLIVKHKGKVYVVQCKRWSADRVIREKHIMQLFGSTIEYCWEWKRKGVHPIEMVGKSIIPVFVTTTELSDTAKQFSERLGVVAVQEQIGDYPQIKCNVGADGEKIYHLPFDQQYNRVIIEPKKGEFMATTVEEAEEKGFRRAKKFYFV